MSWTVIVPVKRLESAKSRLRGAVAGVAHHDLVLAMALDTVAAAVASPVVGRVVVVTNDPDAGQAAIAAGAEVIADVPDAGLNPALAYGACAVRPKGAASLPGVAALAADLPALRADELTAALRAAEAAGPQRRAFVADAAGSGTALLAANPGAGLEPCFGASSAQAHTKSGALRLTGDWPSLSRDVDTAADLADAVALGLGPHTAELLAREAAARLGQDPAAILGAAQATVAPVSANPSLTPAPTVGQGQAVEPAPVASPGPPAVWDPPAAGAAPAAVGG